MANDVKITKKDNYNTLYELVSNAGLDAETEDRLHAFIDHEMELISQRAEKAKQYQREHKASDDSMSNLIYDVLVNSDSPLAVADIVAKIVDSTPQKVVYRLGKLFRAGKITKDIQTIKIEDGPSRKVTFYSVV